MAVPPSRPLLACALALCLAGCLQPEAPDAPPDATGSQAAGAQAQPLPRLSLTGCAGWGATTSPYPAAVAPGEAPAGWGPAPTTVTAVVSLGGYECQRIAVGPFERGPIRLAFDAHDRGDLPTSCRPPGSDYLATGILGTLWVDDAEVAGFLRSAYGMPAVAANLTAAASAAGPATLHTWSWGDGPTSVSILEDSPPFSADTTLRLFWTRGEGIAFLTLESTGQTGRVSPSSGEGHPPSLLAQLPAGRFAGLGRWSPSFDSEGRLAAFRDTLCTEPEPWP